MAFNFSFSEYNFMRYSKNKDRKLPSLLTLREACEILKVHPNTLRQWDRKGILKAVRFGQRGDRRYEKENILELINNKK